jgi:hypothetical protein
VHDGICCALITQIALEALLKAYELQQRVVTRTTGNYQEQRALSIFLCCKATAKMSVQYYNNKRAQYAGTVYFV